MKNLILAVVFVVAACFISYQAIGFVKDITAKANTAMVGKR
jgi:hypothetical protein